MVEHGLTIFVWIWQHFEMVQKVHFMSIENSGFDPKDANWLDSFVNLVCIEA